MRRLGWLTAVGVVLLGSVVEARDKPDAAYVIQGVQPVIFDRGTGQLRPVDASRDMPNAEGELGVIVQLSGPVCADARLQLEVQRLADVQVAKPVGKPKVFTQALGDCRGQPSQKRFFFIQGGALCDALKITASIVGQASSARSVEVPFECGD